jgi:hypothetical protein
VFFFPAYRSSPVRNKKKGKKNKKREKGRKEIKRWLDIERRLVLTSGTALFHSVRKLVRTQRGLEASSFSAQ